VEAVARWSRDATLTTSARLLTGEEVSAIDLQRLFFDKAARFVESGGCEGAVPAAHEILVLWADTLDKLSRRDFPALVSRLDWVLKLQLLERAMEQAPDLNWTSPEIKHLDFKYADLDEGLFWACDQAGVVERVGVPEERIQQFTQEPPENSRAYTRAHLLRLAGPERVEDVDWDRITFKLRSQIGAETRRTVALANPLSFTRRDTEAIFRCNEDLDEVLDLLGAPDRDPEPVTYGGGYWLSGSNPAVNPTSHLLTWRGQSDSDASSR